MEGNEDQRTVYAQTLLTEQEMKALKAFAERFDLTISAALRSLALHHLEIWANGRKFRCLKCGGALRWRRKVSYGRPWNGPVQGPFLKCDSCRWWVPVDDYAEGVRKGRPDIPITLSF